jgi:ElaB/YqjD/DUF883 family membrane-anchored ribosome-binding protein
MHGPLATAITGDKQFDDLFDGVDDLIKRVADVENPEIRKIRAKVHAALVVAKSASQNSVNQVRRPAAQVTDDGGEAMPACPQQEFDVALLVALGLGLVVSLRYDYPG